MSFIIDLNQDTDRVMMNRIDTMDIDLEIKWKKGLEYCFDTKTYIDYQKVKQLQIKMDEQGWKNVPVV